MRSLKNKDQSLLSYLKQENINVFLITESWIKNDDDDKIWLKASCLNRNGYKINNVGRPTTHKGGGIAIVTHETMKVALLNTKQMKFFEYALWRIEYNNEKLDILRIYHPPPSEINQHTIKNFTDEFLELYVELATIYKNFIIAGDFNIQINNKENPEIEQFIKMMETLGLKQTVDFPTHNSGNTIDLIFTEYLTNLELKNISSGPSFSDHHTILVNVNIHKQKVKRIEKSFQNWKKGDLDKLCDKLDLNNLDYNTEYLPQFLNEFENKITEVLNSEVPMKLCKKIERNTQPWFNEDLRTQCKFVRSREKIWRKYKQEHQWLAFKTERDKYHKMIFVVRREYYKMEFHKLRGDTKQTYKLIAKLTGSTSENPLPDSNSDLELSEEFADFFLNKITTIRAKLDNYEKFEPTKKEVMRELTDFAMMDE